MRVVSLVPAATEIAYAIGAGDELVAVTHDCDYPTAATVLPRVTRSTIAGGSSSRDIDAAVREASERGESTFHLDPAALAAVRPDVLLGQTLCSVCAVTVAQLPATPGPAPAVVPLDGASLEGIFEDIRRVGSALGRGAEAAAVLSSLRRRVAAVQARVAGARRPSVVCLEWLDPLFVAGHWVPEQVEHAGGTELLGRRGVSSIDVPDDELFRADPEVLVLLPCGFDADRAVAESARLRADPRWEGMRAVRAGRVFAVDGNAYFSRPGPRVVDGIELLASILHPDRVSSSIRPIRLR
ncbi:MAG TPA: cobalamin-binding protein [Candidatus Limnocylindria bacterium]|nr:cobalamin-binding protein [Candidatus Limnocylindria bacterium]